VGVNRRADEHWIRPALNLGQHAAKQDKVPIGTVIVRDDVVIGEGKNRPISTNDPNAHAEVVALRDVATRNVNYA
jgi:tRNA(adenine34) deaminase